MEFSLNSEQQLLKDSVRRYVDKACDFESRQQQLRQGQQAQAAHWDDFAQNGWLMAALPEEHSGLGGSIIDNTIIAQELGRALVLEPFVGSAVMAAQTLLAGGTEQQKSHWLARMAEGSARLALAYSESASRGMPEPVSLQARKTAQGYTLHGRKSLVLGAVGADAFIVSARVDDGADVALFLVAADSAQLSRQPMPLHDGAWVEELNFNGVAVGEGDRLSGGIDALRIGVAHGTVALCAELIGVMERAIELTAEYLKTRQQFGVPIGSFQVLQHRMADMAGELEVARSMLHVALDSLINDDELQMQQRLSSAKSLICRAAKFVCGQAIQAHGGIGMTEEYAIGHYFKRAIVADLLLGSSDRHDAVCARALQGQLGSQQAVHAAQGATSASIHIEQHTH